MSAPNSEFGQRPVAGRRADLEYRSIEPKVRVQPRLRGFRCDRGRHAATRATFRRDWRREMPGRSRPMLRAQRRRPLAGKRRRLAAHPRATRRLVPQRPFENSGRVGSAGLFRPCLVGRPPGQPASAALSAYRGRNIPCGLSAARILRRSLIAEQVLAARIIWTTIFKARRGDKPFPGLVGEGRVMEAQVVELYRTAARPRSQVAP